MLQPVEVLVILKKKQNKEFMQHLFFAFLGHINLVVYQKTPLSETIHFSTHNICFYECRAIMEARSVSLILSSPLKQFLYTKTRM